VAMTIAASAVGVATWATTATTGSIARA
jgi:hypothetical protein